MRDFVSVRNLGVRYGSGRILDGVGLDIAEGEFVVLLGPSGCGKSTLLNAIAGLIETDDGEVVIAGHDVTFEEPSKRGIAMVFQSYALYPRMTVAQNLSFGLRVARRPRVEIEAAVSKAASLLHLTELLGRRPSELSGGQRQRVAIGRALVRSVPVFLFDEPLSNLDAKLRNELRVEIKKLHQQLGSTIIYVTHDQVEAMTLADRIAVMKNGVIQQFDTPEEIYRRPVNRFVAEFIGSPTMNFIDGVVEISDGNVGLRVGDHRFALEPATLGSTPDDGAPATLALRPEAVHVSRSPGAAREAAQVTVTEPMGPETIVWSDWAGNSLSSRISDSSDIQPGGEVFLDFDLSSASLFDRADGRRL